MGYPEDYTFSTTELMEWDWLPEGEGLTWSTTELYEPEYFALYNGNSVASGKPEYMVKFIDAETGSLHGTVYLNEFYDPVGCSDFKLAEAWRELMSRMGGQTLPGDLYGRSAVEDYARCSVDPRTSTAGRLACNFGGGLAALWTPETSFNTFSALSGGYSAGRLPVNNPTTFKIGIHEPHHYSSLLKREAWHIEILKYQKGISGSHRKFRFPW